ncbi:hypothetical protein RUND412_004776 [Rhizina undulata]
MRRVVQSSASLQPTLLLLLPSRITASATAVQVRSGMGWLGNGYVCASCRRYLFGQSPTPSSSTTASTAATGNFDKAINRGRRNVGVENAVTRGVRLKAGGMRKQQLKWEDEVWEEWDNDGGGDMFQALETKKSQLPQKLRNEIRDKLRQFPGILLESDVAGVGSIGSRLVDRKFLRGDMDLWRMLLVFRKRVYADRGVRDVWKGMRIRNVDLPMVGPQADIFWRVFLVTAFRDEEFLQEIWLYVKAFEKRFGEGNVWDRFYVTLVGYYIVHDTHKALQWHRRLYPKYQPKSWITFMKSAIQRNPQCHETLRKIHVTMENPQLYVDIIKLLSKLEMPVEALTWSRHCFFFGDLPSDSSAADGIFAWTTKYYTINKLRNFMGTFIARGIPIVESSLVEIITARTNTLDVLIMLFDEPMEISISCLGDRFWAALLWKKDICVRDALNYMARLGGHVLVGSKTLKGIMKRARVDRNRALDILSEIGVDFEDTDALNNEKRKYITDVLETSEVAGKVSTEAMLISYLRSYEWREFDALVYSLPRPFSPKVQNLLVQSFIKRQFYEPTLKLLEDMRQNSIPISSRSIKLILRNFLRRRRPGKAPLPVPPAEDDLAFVISLFISFLRSGTTEVDPEMWHEIFRRLGMMRRLQELEKLVLELIDWYHPRHSPFTIRRNVPTGKGGDKTPLDIPERSRENPLRKLFPPIFIRAIVEWGFLDFKSWKTVSEKDPLIPPPLEMKTLHPKYLKMVDWLHSPRLATDFTWGVRLAKRMLDSGVHVDSRSISSALRVRMNVLFGPGVSNVNKNRMAAELNDVSMEQIVAICEHRWGMPLYKRKGWTNEDRYEEDGREKKGWREAMKLEVLGMRKTGMVKRVWMGRGWHSVLLKDKEPAFARAGKSNHHKG